MYHAPLKDMRFVFRHLIDQSALADTHDHDALGDDRQMLFLKKPPNLHLILLRQQMLVEIKDQ